MSTKNSTINLTAKKRKRTETFITVNYKKKMKIENSNKTSLNALIIKDEMKIGDILNSIDDGITQRFYSDLLTQPLFQLKLKELDKFCKYFYGIIGRNSIDASEKLAKNKEIKAKDNNQIKTFKTNISTLTKNKNIFSLRNDDGNYCKIFKSNHYLPVARKYWLSAKNIDIDKWFEYFKNLKNLRHYAEWKDDNGFNIIIWFKIPQNLSKNKMKEWIVHEFKGTFNSLYNKLSKNINFTRIYPEIIEENGKEISQLKEIQNVDVGNEQKEVKTKYLKNEEVNFKTEKTKHQKEKEPMSNYYSKPLKERIALRLNKNKSFNI